MSRSDRVIRDKLDNAYPMERYTLLVEVRQLEGLIVLLLCRLFKEYFRVSLPRTTKEQMQMGNSVRKRNIKVGDVVFKTGKNTHHVGVMINGIQFLHMR